MMKKCKKALAVLLCMLMLTGLLSIVPFTVGAAETESESVETSTYYMDVGDSKTLYLSVPQSVHSALWDTNAPTYVGFLGTTNSYARVKATKYTSLTVIISCTYYYWQKDPLSSMGARYLLHGYKDYYIKINQPKITISFDAAGGSVSPTQRTIGMGDSIGSLPTPTRSNYRFTGWYDTANYRDVNSSTVFEKDSTLRANWVYTGSSSSGSSSTTPSVPAPGKPIISSLTYSGSSNTLKWSSASNATKYKVARKKTGQSDYTYFNTTGTSYTETGVTAGIKYTYQVLAINGSKEGSWSSGKTVATLTKPVVTVSNKSNGIRSEWNAVPGAKKYKVFYKSELDSGWTSKVTSNTYYPLLNTVSGRKYAFQVQPIGASDDITGPYSAVKNIVYQPPVSQEKPVVTMANKSNGIRSEWKAVGGATKYTVYYRQSSASSWSSTQTANTYYPLLNITPGTSYSVQVQPMFGTAKGAYSAVKSLTYIPQVKPTVTLSNKSNSVYGSWNAMSGATKYNVYYKKTADANWSSTQTTNTNFTINNVAAATQYSMQVQPVYGSANGLYSKVATITSSAVSSEKPVVTLSEENNGVKGTWNATSGATKYIVYYKKTADANWSSTETTSTSYTITNVSPSTQYSMQVQPVFGSAKGSYSKVATITTKAVSTEKPVVTLTNKDRGINAGWNAIGGATKYIVYYKETSAGSWNSYETTATSVTFNGLTSGISYSFQVLPMFGSTKGSYSKVVNQVFITTLRPTLTVSRGSNRIDLSWTETAGADCYRLYYTTDDSSGVQKADINGTSAYYSNPVGGKTYYFYVAPVFGDTVGTMSFIEYITY